MQQKIATLTQQCFTRLHNTSETVDDSEKVEVLNAFMCELQLSGYNESDRLNILKGGINTYKKLKKLESLGTRPFYRPNSFEKEKRKRTKFEKKTNWFKGKNCDERFKSVLFVDATPGDVLLKMIKATEDKHRIADDQRIKVVSKSGTKLVHLFEKKNPFAQNCDNNACPPCESIKPEQSKLSMCKVNNVCYECKCETCEKEGKIRTYTGETSRNLHVRSKEHQKDCEQKNKNSWMLKHIMLEHGGQKEGVKFSWRVLRKHDKPLQRQLHEAVRINNKSEDENLNSKSEYNGQRINRISLSSNRTQFNCDTCGHGFNSYIEKDRHTRKFHMRIDCSYNGCDYISFGESGKEEHNKNKHTDVK